DLRREQDCRRVEIGAARWCRPDAKCLVRERDIARVAVRLRVNDDCLETHRPTGALDAKRDLAAIGDQDLIEHQDEPAGPIRNRACPASISSPFSARIASTTPGASAAMSMKVFIASMMQIFCPASIRAPTSISGGSSGAAAR